MRTKFFYAAWLAAGSLMVAACGSDGGGSSADTASASSAAVTTTPTTGAVSSSEAPASTEGSATAPASDASGETAADWDAVVAAAEDEGTVTLYTAHLQNQQDNLEQAFEAAYPGIDLQFQRVLGELEATLDAERDTGAAGADAAVSVVPSIPKKYLAADALIPLDGPHRADWEGNDAFMDGSWFITNYNALGLAWNTDQVSDPITGYDDLLRPELAGKVGIPDGSSSPAVIDYWAFIEENHGGEQYLRDLAAQDPVVYDSAVPLQQALVVGEVAVAAYAVPSILDEQAKGAPIDFALPDPAWTAPFYAFGLAWAQHPNAARVLLDFMMSPEGQEALAVNGASALPGVTGMTELSKTVPSKVAERPEGFAQEFGAKWNDIFGR